MSSLGPRRPSSLNYGRTGRAGPSARTKLTTNPKNYSVGVTFVTLNSFDRRAQSVDPAGHLAVQGLHGRAALWVRSNHLSLTWCHAIL